MDIVERLREINSLCEALFTDPSNTLKEAADEIERLREALREAELKLCSRYFPSKEGE